MGWHLHADVIVPLILLQAAYLYGLYRLQPLPRWRHPIERSHVVWFTAGLLVIFLAEGTPLHEMSEQYLFSAHMVQHMLITLIAAPMLLLGLPPWLVRPLIAARWRLLTGKLLTHPIVAIALFNGMLALWHVPVLYDAALLNHNLHIFNHVLYFTTALLMWWPVFSPLPELPRLSYPGQMLYLFVQSLVPAILAAMITFSDSVLYHPYMLAPRLWADLAPLDDQRIGGLIMKIIGSIILWTLAGFIFFVWFRQEETEVEKSWD